MKSSWKCRFSRFFGLIGASLLALAWGAPPVFAQFNFPNFSSTANLTLNGNASQVGNVLRLTPAQMGQAGSAWFNTQQVVSNGFTAAFQFQITNPTATPADGLAFVIQNSEAGTTAIGPGGGGMGYGSNPNSAGTGIANSLAIEFDTFKNTGDPNANHVAVQNCGTGPNSSDETATFGDSETPCNLGTDSSLETTLANGNVHTVVVNYDSTSDSCEGPALKVYLDGNTAILTVCVNLDARLSLAAGGKALVGFTGATGADYENQDILNWSFTPHRGQTQNQILTFNPGTHVSQTASYDCGTFTPLTGCQGANASSLKLTVGQVKQQITVVVSETLVDGDGSCESGDPNDPLDFDCRFVNHFGTPGVFPAVTVPLCYPYKAGRRCAYYRVENPPSTSSYLGPVDWYVALNDNSFVTSGDCGSFSVPAPFPLPATSYQCNNPQMADDPSTFHPDPNQFTTYITTYFNNSGGQVGIDPGIGGDSPSWSDVAVVFPQTGSKLTLTLQPPLSPGGSISFKQGRTFPLKFQLKQGNIQISNAATAPNTVRLAVLDSNNVLQPIVNPGDPPPSFVLHGNHYQFNLDTSLLAPGTYTLLIDSNLFPQQSFTLILTP